MITERLILVRDHLRAKGLDGLIVPSGDPHVSEYPPGRWRGREWLSGFTGSMGTLIVLADRAALFTNPIYELQAASELSGTGIEAVMVTDDLYTAELTWLLASLQPGATIAADADVMRLDGARALTTGLTRSGIRFEGETDILNAVWHDRPRLPGGALYEHLPPYATCPRSEKLSDIRKRMAEAGATHHLVSSVNDIAWIMNLRGCDVPYNPVFMSHLLISPEKAGLFVAAGTADAALNETLSRDGIELLPYDAIKSALSELGPGDAVLADPKQITAGFAAAIGDGARLVEAINPSIFLKSRKSPADLDNFRMAMEHDGAAMCRFYAWLDLALARGEPVSEITVHERMSAERAREDTFVELSFGTIAGYNGHGAMPHYQATEASDSVIEGNGLLLIDSGGQYLGGTTDITRTWRIGASTARMRRDYTYVLKGVIALSRQRFPEGTLSTYLDSIARGPIWNAGIDYNHGTGHGVGYFLGVHEGPHMIRKAPGEPQMAMHAGMVTSIEPAIYRPGQWGIRTENLVAAVPARTGEEDAFGAWLEFETLTLCPIDMSLIEAELLTPPEVDWLDTYHAGVRQRLSPYLEGEALAWLEARTHPLGAVKAAMTGRAEMKV